MYRRCILGSINRCLNIAKILPNKSKVICTKRFHKTSFETSSAPFPDRYFRKYATSFEINTEALENVTFEQFRQVINDKQVVIIDVREPQELIEDGSLPRYINIPLSELETTLQSMSDKEFAQKYAQPKPSKDTPIVFSCLKGGRSLKAQIKALHLDYTNVKNYIGGWSEWAEKTKKTKNFS